jgi:hypothetical protein
MKTSINKIKTHWIVLSAEKIKQKNEYQRWRTRSRGFCMQTIIKKKPSIYDYNIKELWDMKKFSWMEERAEIQTKGKENVFN